MNKNTELKCLKHAEQLSIIFPNAKKSGIALCRAVRKLEREGGKLAEDYCNGIETDQWEPASDNLTGKLNVLLGNESGKVPVFLNGDPRGYALNIEDCYVRDNNISIHRDLGGYGIIAPDLS